jgi:hypothetical protein
MRKAMSAWLIESKKASASAQMLTCGMFVINARIPPKTKVSRPRFRAPYAPEGYAETRRHCTRLSLHFPVPFALHYKPDA